MNRRQVEVQQVTARNEQEVLNKLQKNYEESLRDIGDKIKDLQSSTLTQSKIYQLEYQKALEKQATGILEIMKANNFTTIADYIQICYEDGFMGTLYDLQGQGIPFIFPIDQDQVTKVCSYSPDDIKLSKRLYDNVDQFKKNVIGEIGRGISNAYTYEQIAKSLAFYGTASIGRAMTIARTEGHRIQQSAALDCQRKAKEKGANVKKQWDSTLDSATRPHHKELDGHIREIEEPFEVAGLKAMHPGAFGTASEDCNCRCCVLPYTEWEIPEEEYTKMNGDTNELVKIKAKDYNKFKESAKGHLMKMQFPSDIYKVNGVTKEVKEELESALLKLESEYDIRLSSISVEKAGKRDIFVVGYHDGVMDMVVNADADFGRIIERMGEQYKLEYFAGKSLEDYLAHETAHIMLYQDCNSDSAYHAKYQQIESLYGSLKGVSGYADRSKSGNEALAEAFVRVRNKEAVEPIVKILVESYFERWKK